MSDPSVWSLFLRAAKAAPEAECVVWGRTRETYDEVRSRASAIACHLKALGLGRRRAHAELEAHESGQDHVAIYMHNRPEYVESALAAFASRTVPLNVNYRYTPAELIEILASARTRAIIYEARFRENVQRIREQLPELVALIQVGDGPSLPGAASYEDIVSRGAQLEDDTSGDDLCIVYTGGTTGAPKAVLWRQADLCWSLTGGVNSATGKPISDLGDLASSAGQVAYRVLVLPPMMHLAGLSMVLIGLPAGATLLLPDTPSFDARAVLRMAEEERAGVVLLVGNAMGRPLVDELSRATYDLSRVRGIINGAAPMSPDVREGLLRALGPSAYVFDSVGSSESGKQLQVLHRKGGEPKPGGEKRFAALPTTFVLSQDKTRLLKQDDSELGWLASTGRLPRGYFGDERKTRETFPVIGGVRYAIPGDRARYDENGGVELLGRDAVTINSGGEKIFAEEVEAAILACEGVRDVIVVGRPSDRWGSEVVAVVSRTDAALEAIDIVGACAQRIAAYKLPKEIIFVDEVYRAPNGKADYAWARGIATTRAAVSGAA